MKNNISSLLFAITAFFLSSNFSYGEVVTINIDSGVNSQNIDNGGNSDVSYIVNIRNNGTTQQGYVGNLNVIGNTQAEINLTNSDNNFAASGVINLGTNPNSLFNIAKGGQISNSFTFGNSSQALNLSSEQQFSHFTGSISGNGQVNIGKNGIVILDKSHTLDASINGMAGSNSFVGSLQIVKPGGTDVKVTTNTNIGSVRAFGSIFVENSELDLATNNNSLNVSSVNLSKGKITIGSEAVRSIVQLLSPFITSDSVVDFKETNSLYGNIDLGSDASSFINVSSDKDLSTSTFNIISSAIKLNSGSTLNVGSGTINAKILTLQDGEGEVNFSTSKTLLQDIGESDKKIGLVTVSANNTLSNSDKNIYANEIRLNLGSAFDLGTGVFSGNITGASNGVGKVDVTQDSSLAQDIGALDNKVALVEIAADKTLSNAANDIYSTEVKLNSGSILNIGSGAIDAVIIASANNVGTLNVTETKTLAQDVGTEAAKIALVEVFAGKSLSNSTKNLYSTEVKLNSGSILNIGSGVFDAAIVASANNVGTVNVTETKTLAQDVGTEAAKIALVEVFAGKSLSNSTKNLYSTEVKLNDGSVLNIGSGAIDAAITAAINNVGTVNFTETKTLAQDVGTADKKLNLVEIAADKSLSNSTKNLYSTEVKLNSGSVLNIGSGVVDAAIIASANNVGTVNVTETKTLAQDVGQNNANIGLVTIAANKTLTAGTKNIYSNEVRLNSGSILTLSNAAVGSITAQAAGVGRVNLTKSTTIENIGTLAQKVDVVNISRVGSGQPSITSTIGANKGIYANEIQIGALSSLDLSATGSVINANVNLMNGFSRFTIGNLNNFQGNVSGIGSLSIQNNNGDVNFAIGSNTQQIANLYFTNGTYNINSSNIYSRSANVADSTINLTANSGNNFNGSLYINNSTVNLESGEHHVTDILSITQNSIIAVNVADSGAGSIIAGTQAIVEENTKLNLNIAQNALTSSKDFVLISGQTSAISNITGANLYINNSNTSLFNNSFKFVTTVEGNQLVLHAENMRQRDYGTSNNNILFNNILDLPNADGHLQDIRNILIDNNNAATSQEILSQLSSQVDSSAHRVSFENSINIANILSDRMVAVRGLASGDCGDNKTSWVQVFGSKIKQDDKSAVKGYDASSNGFALGFDREVFEDSLLGFSVSYAKSEIDSNDNLKSINIDTYQASIYGNTQLDSYFVNGAATYSFNEYSSNRKISVINSQATAKYNGNTYAAKVELGRNYKFADAIITPTIALTAARNHINDYSETGAGNVNLAVKNNDTSLFEARFGTKIAKQFVVSSRSKINPSLKLSYGYDFIGDKQRATANFVGQSNSFTSSSNSMPQGSLRANFATEIFYMDSFSFDLEYGFDYRSSYQAHSGSLKGKYQF